VNIYIAGAWSDRPFLRNVRTALIGHGHHVTASWLDIPDDAQGTAVEATADLEDIRACDTFLLFADVPSTSGGYHVETGYALALGKSIIAVGTKSNLFHHLIPTWYRTWLDVADVAARREAA
jgi:nucleoside 2-deoxyribosyltransferase